MLWLIIIEIVIVPDDLYKYLMVSLVLIGYHAVYQTQHLLVLYLLSCILHFVLLLLIVFPQNGLLPISISINNNISIDRCISMIVWYLMNTCWLFIFMSDYGYLHHFLCFLCSFIVLIINIIINQIIDTNLHSFYHH